MGFFNIFSKKNSNENAVNISLSAAEPAEAKESIENVLLRRPMTKALASHSQCLMPQAGR